MTWELLAGAAIILFAVLQLGMAALSWFFYPMVNRWRESLLMSSHPILAKSALIIFF